MYKYNVTILRNCIVLRNYAIYDVILHRVLFSVLYLYVIVSDRSKCEDKYLCVLIVYKCINTPLNIIDAFIVFIILY